MRWHWFFFLSVYQGLKQYFSTFLTQIWSIDNIFSRACKIQHKDPPPIYSMFKEPWIRPTQPVKEIQQSLTTSLSLVTLPKPPNTCHTSVEPHLMEDLLVKTSVKISFFLISAHSWLAGRIWWSWSWSYMERQTAGIPSYINECEHENSNHASHGHRRRDVLRVC